LYLVPVVMSRSFCNPKRTALPILILFQEYQNGYYFGTTAASVT
jgi:hypothetical protein